MFGAWCLVFGVWVPTLAVLAGHPVARSLDAGRQGAECVQLESRRVDMDPTGQGTQGHGRCHEVQVLDTTVLQPECHKAQCCLVGAVR